MPPLARRGQKKRVERGRSVGRRLNKLTKRAVRLNGQLNQAGAKDKLQCMRLAVFSELTNMQL